MTHFLKPTVVDSASLSYPRLFSQWTPLQKSVEEDEVLPATVVLSRCKREKADSLVRASFVNDQSSHTAPIPGDP